LSETPSYSGLLKAIRAGQVKYREEIFDGLASLPAAFSGLFTGQSFGRRLIRV
jgi:NADPH-dependent curcumin reductase CurA